MSNSAISLYELNNHIKGLFKEGFPDMFWIRAEMSDVRVNQNGHCYLEFIEKDKAGRTIIAKARAMIWSNTFHLLRTYFEDTTKQPFTSGLKVLVQVGIEFHELYGFSLTVYDIDPSYTLGDQAQNRAVILKQLEEDGVLTLNKELELPTLTNRIAIISSPTAAGYEDFCNQIENNQFGFPFYTKLFAAIMQGDRAESSIITALEKIYQHLNCFDAVVIIRGGGATSELSCFDSYLLAASCAQFPLPIITGIGHERDETVLDIVAHTRAKTPTAVAEFLIGNLADTAAQLEDIQSAMTNTVRQLLQNERQKLATNETSIGYSLKSWGKEQNAIMASIRAGLIRNALQITKDNQNSINNLAILLKKDILSKNKELNSIIDNAEKHLQLISPESLLRKGYTMTLKNGKLIKSAAALNENDIITTVFADGKKDSIIK